jgi:hypothetical protein
MGVSARHRWWLDDADASSAREYWRVSGKGPAGTALNDEAASPLVAAIAQVAFKKPRRVSNPEGTGWENY